MTDKGQRTVLHIAALHHQKPSDFDYMRKFFFFQIYCLCESIPKCHVWSTFSWVIATYE
jgi:hypothetical protein